MSTLTENQIESVVKTVLGESGQVVWLEPGQVMSSHFEMAINCQPQDIEDFEKKFRAEFSRILEKFANMPEDVHPKMRTGNPIFIYRKPSLLPISTGGFLASLHVGFPIIDKPLPQVDLDKYLKQA